MSVSRGLRALHRLNELASAERRREAALQQQKLAEARQDEDVGLGHVKTWSGAMNDLTRPSSLDLPAFQQISEGLQMAVDRLGALQAHRQQEEAAFEQKLQECFALDQRNRTLERVMRLRRVSAEQAAQCKTLRELDGIWLQRQGRA